VFILFIDWVVNQPASLNLMALTWLWTYVINIST